MADFLLRAPSTLLAILAAAALAGCGLLLACSLRAGTLWITRLPINRWNLGVKSIEFDYDRPEPIKVGWIANLGFFRVWRLTGWPRSPHKPDCPAVRE